MSGSLNSTLPIFQVADIQSTISWYQNNLNFNIIPYPDDPPYDFAVLLKEEMGLMLRKVDGYSRGQGNIFEWDAYFTLKSGQIQGLYDELQARDVTFLRDMEKTIRGNFEFEVVDCNEYVLCFSQSDFS